MVYAIFCLELHLDDSPKQLSDRSSFRGQSVLHIRCRLWYSMHIPLLSKASPQSLLGDQDATGHEPNLPQCLAKVHRFKNFPGESHREAGNSSTICLQGLSNLE